MRGAILGPDVEFQSIAVRDSRSAVVDLIDPSAFSLKEQLDFYSRSWIIVTIWGGISMLDFLAPEGAVEVVVTTWVTNFKQQQTLWHF